MQTFGLEQELIDTINTIFLENKKIEKVLIFGSRAKGNFITGSDIDLALIGENISHEDIINIKLAIDDIALLYSVDIVAYNDVKNTPIGDHIKRIGKIFYIRER